MRSARDDFWVSDVVAHWERCNCDYRTLDYSFPVWNFACVEKEHLSSCMNIVDQFKIKVAESKAREDAIRANPALASTPAMKKMYRQHGVVIFILGVAVAVGDVIGWEVVGGALIIMLAIPIVLIPSGIYMMLTGKNPFGKK